MRLNIEARPSAPSVLFIYKALVIESTNSNASVLWFGEFLNRSRIMAPKSFEIRRSGTSDNLLSLRPNEDIFFSNMRSYSSLSLTSLVVSVSVDD